MAFVPYLAWFFEASWQEWIISIAFIIIYPASSFGISYLISEGIRKLIKKPMLKHKSFEIAYFFTLGTLCLFSIVGFIVVMVWFYSDPDYRHPISQPLAGIAVFSAIATIIMTVTSNSLDKINPFKLEKKTYLKKKSKEDATEYLKSKLLAFKQKCADWTKENKYEIQRISKKAGILEKKIDKREKYLNDFVREYYDNIPTCTRCNSNCLLLLDINNSGTGIEIQCEKCEKSIWMHSKQSEINNGLKYKNYLDEYFSFYQEGYELYALVEAISDERIDLLFDERADLEEIDGFDELIELEKRYKNVTDFYDDSLKPGKSYHPLDPNKFYELHHKILDKVSGETIIFFRKDEDSLDKLDYIWFVSDVKKIDKKRPEIKREPIPQKVKNDVWNRDGGKCVKCDSNENLEFDHIIPFSKGGASTFRNLQLLCEPCNRKKSAKIG